MNIEKITNNMANNLMKNSEEFPASIKATRKVYSDFLNKIERSDLKNGHTRFMSELVYVRQLKQLYNKYGFSDLFQEMTNKESEILEILKTQFGITYKT